MTKETQLKNQIKDYLNIKGIFWWYNLQGIGAYKGLPDIFAIKNSRIFGIEVKTMKGKLSDYQVQYLNRLNRNGGISIIARSLEDVTKYI